MSYCPASNENLLASYSRKLYHEARKRVKRDFLVIPTACTRSARERTLSVAEVEVEGRAAPLGC